MTLANMIDEAKRLSPDERIELWNAVGEMIGPPHPQTEPFTITPAQSADLKQRLEDERTGNTSEIPGDEVVAKVKALL